TAKATSVTNATNAGACPTRPIRPPTLLARSLPTYPTSRLISAESRLLCSGTEQQSRQ
ncbi:hypothetical protein FS749_001025, partial [Ceratobasidium sp. UAMH 11750]